MNKILDRAILLLYCLGAVLLQKADTAFLVAFLLSVIFTCLGFYINLKWYHFIISTIYVLLTFFFPELLFFCPVILYGLAEDSYYIGGILINIACMCHCLPHSWHILLFVILGNIIALLLHYHTYSYETLHDEFKKTRDDSMEHNLLLKQKNQALLANQDYEIYTATLKERNRIAREIHDNVGHMLSRSILLTGAIKTISKEDSITQLLEQLEGTLNTAMNSIRESVHDLHDESVNLKEALTSLTDTFSFCPVELDFDMSYQIPRAVKYSFITITKEALNNIIKHSNATKVHIIVREHPGLFQLIIEDNGTNVKQPNNTGLGLINMKDRVDALNGTLQIQTENGFRIFITIPKKEELK